jgi:hypothetical protein
VDFGSMLVSLAFEPIEKVSKEMQGKTINFSLEEAAKDTAVQFVIIHSRKRQ